MGNAKTSNEREFKIASTKAAQEAYLKYKDSENNKITQISHITTVIIIALLSQAKGTVYVSAFLIVGLISVFSSYICFYYADYHGATVNVSAMVKAYAEAYEANGFSE